MTGQAMRRRTKSSKRAAPTLHAVAASAGCSTATVSKALNGLPVSPENLAKVFAAAEKLGYVPNLAARSMRSVQTMTIGMVINFDVHPRSELMGVLQSMIGDMEARGYTVLVSVVRGTGVDVDTLLRRFIERRVDGLFYWNAQPEKSLSWYRRSGVPVLAVGFRAAECTGLPLVTVDGAPAFAAAVERLRVLGHRVAAEFSVGSGTRLHSGLLDPGMTRVDEMASVAKKLRWIDVDACHDRDSVRAALESLMAAKRRPTVVFASLPTSLQILSIAESARIRVPADLSVIAMNDLEEAELLRTPLSAMRTSYEMMGHAAARSMLDALEGKIVRDVIVPNAVEWIERASTGPAPKT